MTRTYIKGRISKDKRRGFRRSITYKCHCSYCHDPHKKAHRKTEERNLIKSLMIEYAKNPVENFPNALLDLKI
jgi:hypothetical protein